MSRDADSNIEKIRGSRILVVGMGRSGMAAVRVLNDIGAVVTVQDISTVDKIDPKFVKYIEREDIDSCFGYEPDDMGVFDTVVLSPGVAPHLPFLNDARRKGVEVIGEIEMAYRITRGRYVAITGTNGKTTTTALTGTIFEADGRKTAVVGNIGKPVITEAAKSDEDEWLVTETSSFQLETTVDFRPEISAILNLTPDHLNRHKTMEAYGAAKANIFRNQTEDDYLVINFDDKTCYELADTCEAMVIPFSRREELDIGAYLVGDMIVVKDEDGIVHEICSRNDLKIIGDHNVENALAAAAISFFAGIAPDVIAEGLRKFHGVEHRIEYCGMVDGVSFYNDSKGTNVDAALVALRALKENIILIAGGDGKGQDFTHFGEEIAKNVKHLILIGRDGEKIGDAARKAGFSSIYSGKDMNECVHIAMEIAEKGDRVLLSPACASWDMYDNYEQRGDHFKNCVNLLLR
jgi:UDP-N-acetylmuramoylalanine--D-glutamate ligase